MTDLDALVAAAEENPHDDATLAALADSLGEASGPARLALLRRWLVGYPKLLAAQIAAALADAQLLPPITSVNPLPGTVGALMPLGAASPWDAFQAAIISGLNPNTITDIRLPPGPPLTFHSPPDPDVRGTHPGINDTNNYEPRPTNPFAPGMPITISIEDIEGDMVVPITYPDGPHRTHVRLPPLDPPAPPA